eukprot:m.99018 g.99018  ORF g.99018 m.99018 type:complete len:138 (+) comp8878_c0_seq1:242-655(+)
MSRLRPTGNRTGHSRILSAFSSTGTAVESLSLYIDYKQDESYTPNRLAVRVGTNFHDLKELCTKDLSEPDGWVDISLLQPDGRPTRTFIVQVVILSNHQNGRDTHVRLARIFAARTNSFPPCATMLSPECAPFTSLR